MAVFCAESAPSRAGIAEEELSRCQFDMLSNAEDSVMEEVFYGCE